MKKNKNIVWGLILIVIGLILGGNALGITRIDLFFDGWWTLFIIVPCLVRLFKDTNKTLDIIGLVIGTLLLLLESQDIIRFNLFSKIWVPVMLLCTGVLMIYKEVIARKINEQIERLEKNKTK